MAEKRRTRRTNPKLINSTVRFKITIILTIFILSATKSWSHTPEWLTRRLADLERAKTLGAENRLEILGGAVTAGYQRGNRIISPAQLELSNQARIQILAIPGHAEYFGSKITDTYDLVKKGYAEGKHSGQVPWYGMSNRRNENFPILSMLPSTETVRVLGDMLEDDWKWPGYGIEHIDGEGPTLDHHALTYLAKLPFADPPTIPPTNTEEVADNLDAWKKWYSEIKAGRRTFRFIGDETEYDLRGPVRRGEMNDRSRGATRPHEASAEKSLPKQSEQSSNRLLPYIIGVSFLLAGFFIYFRGRKNAN